MLGSAAAAGRLTGSAFVAVGVAVGVATGVPAGVAVGTTVGVTTGVTTGVTAGVTTGVTLVSVGVAAGVTADSLDRVLVPTELAGFRTRDTMVVTATVTIPTGIRMSVARASPRTRCC